MTRRDRHLQDRLLHDNIVKNRGSSNPGSGLLVVSSSKINRIVIAKTAVMAGLRTFETEPALAGEAYDLHKPDAVLIDCNGDDTVCGPLFRQIAAIASVSGLPRILVIARDSGTCQHHRDAEVDFLMDSPITTDRLGTALHSLFDDK